jgi:ComF family protein
VDPAHRPRCPACRLTERPVARARAIGPYDGRLRDIIHALKYGERRTVARRLSALMAAAGPDVLAGADAVVPVPLHWRRRHSRGFNQAALLAEPLGLPVRHLLRRCRSTRSQVDLPAEARHTNVAGAFGIRRGARMPETVILVDDVATTGATLDACAVVLKAAGVLEVRALTAARVVTRRRRPRR